LMEAVAHQQGAQMDNLMEELSALRSTLELLALVQSNTSRRPDFVV